MSSELTAAPPGRCVKAANGGSYRARVPAGAQAALIATTEHSVLARRWVYDPTADPVDVAALATAVLDGGTHADIDVATDTGLRRREPTTLVTGSGSTVAGASHSWAATGPVAATAVATTTVIAAGGLELVVLHVVDRHTTSGPPGAPTPALLAYVRTVPNSSRGNKPNRPRLRT